MSVLAELLRVPAAFQAQRAPRHRLDALLTEGLAAVLAHARARVPAYAGPTYDIEISAPGDLAALPVLPKRDVLADPSGFHDARRAEDEYFTVRTSGSTGRALEVRHDWDNWAHDRAVNVRRMLATGAYRPWHRLYQIKAWSIPPRWHERIGLFRRLVIDGNLPLARTKAIVVERPPVALMGYPSVLRDLLRAFDPDELARVRRSVRLLLTDSELLTPPVRDQLTEGYRAPVFDEYSSFETYHIAFGCPFGSLHIAEDRIYLEIVDDSGRPVPDGTDGSVVVTNYRERAMPLIRYQLGDIGAIDPEPCPCGRTLRGLKLTRGRMDDYVLLPDGHKLYFGTFVSVVRHVDGIADCMVRQDAAGQIRFILVEEPGSGRSFDQIAGDAIAHVHAIAGRTFPIRAERGDGVERTPAGKGRFIVSEYRPQDTT